MNKKYIGNTPANDESQKKALELSHLATSAKQTTAHIVHKGKQLW